MAQMKTVEVADSNCRSVRKNRPFLETMEDLHGFRG